jgi:hypothetical protein
MLEILYDQARRTAQEAAGKLVGQPLTYTDGSVIGHGPVADGHFWFEDANGDEYAASVRIKQNPVVIGSRFVYVRVVKVV